MSSSYRFVAPIVAILALALVACGDSSDGTSSSTPTPSPDSSPAADGTATPTLAPNPNEHGSDPVYYRASDDFASVVAGKPYTVVFRITNGYQGPTLTITGTPEGGGEPASFVADLSEPVGNEWPGSYYPVNIDLPTAGAWTLVVSAGDDDVSIPITVVDAISTPAG